MANCIPLVTTVIACSSREQPGIRSASQRSAGTRTLHVRGVAARDGPAVAIVGARAATGAAMDARARARQAPRRRAASTSCRAARSASTARPIAARSPAAARRRSCSAAASTSRIPRATRALFDEVVARGGALVSLFADRHAAARAARSSQRNPLIAALADAVIVVEADVASGSLSTARAARELGRVVARVARAAAAAIGCSPTGAALVESADDADRRARRDAAPAARRRALDPIAARGARRDRARVRAASTRSSRHTGLAGARRAACSASTRGSSARLS